MLKEEIIEKISKYFKLTSYEAEKIYDDIFSIIISGIRQDNIVDVTNFGEFIIKYNEGNGDTEISSHKKTAEFLATSKLEEEINQNSFERSLYTFPETQQEETHVDDLSAAGNKLVEKKEIPDIHDIDVNSPVFIAPVTEPAGEKKVEPIVPQPIVSKTEIPTVKPEEHVTEKTLSTEHIEGENPVEEEMRLKREQILSKLTKPLVEKKPLDQTTPYVPLIKLPQKETSQPLFTQENKETLVSKTTSEVPKVEVVETPTFEHVEPVKIEQKIPEQIVPETIEAKSKEEDDFSQKSFSDFFTEVKHQETEKVESTIPVEEHESQLHNVIPPSVVELHNEITSSSQGDTLHEMAFPTAEVPKTPISTNGNGNGSAAGEYRASDNSYYIWYKDVEANAVDTQNLSFEYELLYQATKEAEYKSRLKIYVTTFIVFFSIVLVLLIFSPVIYKLFFKPIESPATENVQQQPVVEQQAPDNKASQNVLPQNTTQQQQPAEQNNANVTPPVTANDQQQNNTQQQTTQQTLQQPVEQKTEQKQPEQKKQEQTTQPQQQTQTTEPKMEGVTKNSMGWMDDKFKVIYVKLDNGKYTIQESAWDSDQKANKRIGTVLNYKISGLSGSVLKVDLGDKGTWFRARFGEFSTLEEARVKAEELRTKEKTKLQASLFFFLLYA